jgi:hypothetical protein
MGVLIGERRTVNGESLTEKQSKPNRLLLPPMTTLCKNCQEPVTRNFCGNCGQKASVHRISIPELLHDLPRILFNIDKGFLFNFFQFFRRPGQAITDYLSGKRIPFFHPISYLIIALLLNYVIVVLVDLHFFDAQELLTMDPVQAQAIQEYDAMQWWFLEHTYIYILLAIPASCLFLFLIFRMVKRNFNVAESTVVVLFTIAQGVLIQSLLYLCFGWSNSGVFIRTLELINICILTGYATFVMYQLMTTARQSVVRFVMSLIGGIGLAAVWMASAYVLYLLIG